MRTHKTQTELRVAMHPHLRKSPTIATVNIQFEPLLDSDEAAMLLKIHPKTLQKMARKGEVFGIHLGKLWRFRASDLDAWLKKIAG